MNEDELRRASCDEAVAELRREVAALFTPRLVRLAEWIGRQLDRWRRR